MLGLYSRVPQSLWRLGFGVCLVGVLYLALSPAPPQALSTGWDKANHALAFTGLTFLWMQAYRTSIGRGAVALILLGILIELLQSTVPNRMAEWGDLLADIIGMIAGYAAYRLVHYLIPQSSKQRLS